jgi:hypothetical protein
MNKKTDFLSGTGFVICFVGTGFRGIPVHNINEVFNLKTGD